jgi:hypothetical protein
MSPSTQRPTQMMESAALNFWLYTLIIQLNECSMIPVSRTFQPLPKAASHCQRASFKHLHRPYCVNLVSLL